jgi:hydrogenase maturation protein HypF
MLGESAFDLLHLPPLQAFEKGELAILRPVLRQGINAPLTSSAGRLFDAMASLLNLRHQNRFEGQAAMELEFLAEQATDDGSCGSYDFTLGPARGTPIPHRGSPARATASPAMCPAEIDWQPMVESAIGELSVGVAVSVIAARFHHALAAMAVAVAQAAGCRRVVLTGGCFQNRLLTERCVDGLRRAGFCPYWHQRVPPNDGGLALGQVLAAARVGR